MVRQVGLFFAIVLSTTPAFAADSVFEPRAFEGRFSIALTDSSGRPIRNYGGDSLFLAFVPEAEGVALINSLGDPGFNANNCPPPQQKREYYVSYQSTGVATHVGCTNGSSFFLRIRVGGEQGGIRPSENGDTGVVRFTQITSGPPATATGTGSSDRTPAFQVVLAYQSGGPGTPFARVPEDYIVPTGSTPARGTALTAGSTQNLNLNVRFRLTSAKTGTLQSALYNGEQVLATIPPANVGAAVGENTWGFNFPSVAVPDSGALTVRSELRSSATGAVLATASVSWPVFQAPALTAAPNLVRFQSAAGTAKQTDSIFVLTTSAQRLNYTATVVNGSKWLSPGAATDPVSGSATVPLTMDPTGLAPGYYFDTVRVTTGLGSVDVPVALRVGPRPVSLNVEPNGLRFDARQGQGSPMAQTLNVYHSGPEGSSTEWSARVVAGANLVQLSATSGTATPGNPSTISVSLSRAATDVVGVAQALLEISSPNTPPEYVVVAANVTANTTPAQLMLTPASSIFFAPLNGSPVTQRVQVNLSELTPTNFTANFSGGGGTMTATPANGAVSTTSPGSIEIAYNPTASTQATLNVSTANSLRSSRLFGIALPPAGTACTSTGIWIRETSLQSRFSIPAGLPQPLTVQLYDNCGNRLKGGSVAVSFSNGDPSLRLEMDEATGDFAGTWVPQTALNTAVAVTLRPTFGTLFQRTLEISGTVTGNADAPPRLVSGGILNNLNPIVGAPLAPGTIAQVYGDRFYAGDGFTSAPAPPLAPRFQGAQLLISGIPAPMYYISKSLAAVQIPTEIEPDRTYSALMEVNGVYSVPQSFEVVAAAPGTVSLSGALVAQHAADYQLVTGEYPAKPGESLVMYLVGMGGTSPSVSTGAPAPGNPLAQAVVQPTVTIDNQPATVQFAGLSPGFAGLYQINFSVPATARDGDLDVVIAQGASRANPTKLMVKK